MTQEEKQLLLKDLCARLPYGVEIICEASKISLTLTPHMLEEIFKDNNKLEWKPYLRPMSSLTEEEKKELNECYGSEESTISDTEVAIKLLDFYNTKHLDYRGLIPICIALEAPEGMYE